MVQTNPARCRDCGEPIQWLKTKAGKLAPFDLEPRIHFASCKKRLRSPASDAVAGLMILGYKKREAEKMLKGIPIDDVGKAIVEALRRVGGC